MMSATLVRRVLESALDADLKPVAIVLADHVYNDDGTGLYPSRERIAWCLGRTSRAVSSALVRLRNMGILIPLTPMIAVNGHLQPRGGRGRSTEYRFASE